MSAHLSENAYGKSRVRVTKVQRDAAAGRHDLFEFDVAIQLRGAFDECYTAGDNSGVLPTDTMRNTVYALAAKTGITSPEQFALLLADHFVAHEQIPHATSVRIDLRADRWKRIHDEARREHPWAFINGGRELRTCTVEQGRDRPRVLLSAGIDDLLLIKTTDSAFVDFVRDEYTTLPDAQDRIFASAVRATWRYAESAADSDWNDCFETARDAMIRTFAAHKSLAVQHTLYAMGEAALAACGAIDEIEIWMPNQHRVPFDLRPLGLENRNEVCVTTSEPFGLIGGTIRRT
jgi:urate oxidase